MDADVEIGAAGELLDGMREGRTGRGDAARGDDALAVGADGAERHALVEADVVGGHEQALHRVSAFGISVRSGRGGGWRRTG